MADVTKQKSDLSEILRILKEKDLSRLAAVNGAKQEMAAQISDLRRKRSQACLDSGDPDQFTPARLAGADILWRQIIAAQIVAKNLDLAGLFAEVEEQKMRARMSLGRDEAFRKILNRRRIG